MVKKKKKSKKNKKKKSGKKRTPVSKMSKKQLRLAKKIHRSRGRRARKIDEKLAGKVPKYFETWLRHPERYDLPDIDLGTRKRKHKKYYEVGVEIGGKYTRSGYRIQNINYVYYRGKWYSLNEAQKKGIIKILEKKSGLAKIQLPSTARLIHLYYYRKGFDPSNSWILVNGKKYKLADAEKKIQVRLKKSGRIYTIHVEGFKYKNLFVPVYAYYVRSDGTYSGININHPEKLREKLKELVQRIKASAKYSDRYKKLASRLNVVAFKIRRHDKYAVIVYGNTYPVRQQLKRLGFKYTREPVTTVAKEAAKIAYPAPSGEKEKLARTAYMLKIEERLEKDDTRKLLLSNRGAYYAIIPRSRLNTIKKEIQKLNQELIR